MNPRALICSRCGIRTAQPKTIYLFKMLSRLSSFLSIRPSLLVVSLAMVGAFIPPAWGQTAGNKGAASTDFLADVASRAETTKAIKDGKQDPVAALAGLSTAAKMASAPSGGTELRYGWAAIDVGMRLRYSGEPAAALKVFAEAERILYKAARDFSATEKKDRAQALYSLGYIQWQYLQKPADAMDAFVSALQDDPTNESVQTAKRQLDVQWGPAIALVRKKTS